MVDVRKRLAAWGVDPCLLAGAYDFESVVRDYFTEKGPLPRLVADVDPPAEELPSSEEQEPRCALCGRAGAPLDVVLGTWVDTGRVVRFRACQTHGRCPGRETLQLSAALAQHAVTRSADEAVCRAAVEENIGMLVVLNGRLFDWGAVLLSSPF